MHIGRSGQNAAEAMKPKRGRIGQLNFFAIALLGIAIATANSHTWQREQRNVTKALSDNEAKQLPLQSLAKDEGTESDSSSSSSEYQEDFNSYEQDVDSDESIETERTEPNVSTTVNEQIRQTLQAAAPTTSAEEDLDGRSASYVNNQFIQNPPPEPLPEASPPLYQLIQQQMEQVLASTAPEFTLYNNVNTNVGSKTAKESLPNKPIFGYSGDSNSGEDYAAVETSQTETAAQYLSELPSPIVTKRPKAQNGVANVVAPSAATLGIEHKHKRRIIFKTVSTASHFVATPLADLMFKFSIGIAKPPPQPNKQPLSEPNGNQLTRPNESAYATAAPSDRPKRKRPVAQAEPPKKFIHSKN